MRWPFVLSGYCESVNPTPPLRLSGSSQLALLLRMLRYNGGGGIYWVVIQNKV